MIYFKKIKEVKAKGIKMSMHLNRQRVSVHTRTMMLLYLLWEGGRAIFIF